MRVGARTVLVERRVEVKDVPKFVAGEAVLAHVTDPITRIRLSTRASTARAHPLPDPIYVTPATCRSPPLNSTAGASHSRVTLAAGGAESSRLVRIKRRPPRGAACVSTLPPVRSHAVRVVMRDAGGRIDERLSFRCGSV